MGLLQTYTDETHGTHPETDKAAFVSEGKALALGMDDGVWCSHNDHDVNRPPVLTSTQEFRSWFSGYLSTCARTSIHAKVVPRTSKSDWTEIASAMNMQAAYQYCLRLDRSTCTMLRVHFGMCGLVTISTDNFPDSWEVRVQNMFDELTRFVASKAGILSLLTS